MRFYTVLKLLFNSRFRKSSNLFFDNVHHEVISKYERNLELIRAFVQDYQLFLNRFNKWDSTAFFDSNITNRHYFNLLVTTALNEYTPDVLHDIRTYKLEKKIANQFIKSLDNQYNSLKLLHNDIVSKMS